MEVMIKIKCPYCNYSQHQLIKRGTQLVYCGPDDGGCDKEFVIDVKFVPEYKTYKLTEVS